MSCPKFSFLFHSVEPQITTGTAAWEFITGINRLPIVMDFDKFSDAARIDGLVKDAYRAGLEDGKAALRETVYEALHAS